MGSVNAIDVAALWSHLRDSVAAGASRTSWDIVRDCFERWPADPSRDDALEWTTSMLAAWPDRGYRGVSGAALDEHRKGAPLPIWWPLVRHVTLLPGQPLAPIEALSHITSLWALGGATDLSPLALLTGLRELDLSRNEGVLTMPSLAALQQLETLTITEILYPFDLGPLAGLEQLHTLFIGGNPYLTDLSPLTGLPELTKLHVSACNSLVELAPIGLLSALQELNVSGLHAIADLAPVSALRSLRALDAIDLELASLDSIRGLDGLERLSVGGRYLTDIGAIASFPRLASLQIHAAPALRDISPVTRATALRKVTIAGGAAITDLSPLSHLPHLERLELLPVHPDEGTLSSLGSRAVRELSLIRHASLRSVDFIRNMPALEILDLRDCSQLADVSALISLRGLNKLVVLGCPLIRDLEAVRHAHPGLELVR